MGESGALKSRRCYGRRRGKVVVTGVVYLGEEVVLRVETGIAVCAVERRVGENSSSEKSGPSSYGTELV